MPPCFSVVPFLWYAVHSSTLLGVRQVEVCAIGHQTSADGRGQSQGSANCRDGAAGRVSVSEPPDVLMTVRNSTPPDKPKVPGCSLCQRSG